MSHGDGAPMRPWEISCTLREAEELGARAARHMADLEEGCPFTANAEDRAKVFDPAAREAWRRGWTMATREKLMGAKVDAAIAERHEMKSTAKDVIIEVGRVLYDTAAFARSLAADLDVDPHQVRRWLNGTRPVPDAAWRKIERLLWARKASITATLRAVSSL